MDDEISLGDYWRILKRHWPIFFVGFIIVFSAVLTYTFLSEPVYESRSLVVITSQDQANFLLGSSASRVGDIETQRTIIQSYIIVHPVFLEFGEFDLIVNNIRNSNILEIVVRTNNPELAANIANKITENYIYYNANLRREDATSNVMFITDTITEYNIEVNELDALLTSLGDFSNLTRAGQLEYRELERQINAKTRIIEFLLTKREEALLTTQLNSINLRILEYAPIPDYPIRPNIPLNIAIGFILALGAGLGLAILFENILPKKPDNKRLIRIAQE